MQEMIRTYGRRYWRYLLGGSIVLGISLFYLLFYARQQTDNRTSWEQLTTDETQATIRQAVTESSYEEEATTIAYVDVKGAVKQPGIYEVALDMRVWDALELAGGVLDTAETTAVNFAQKVSDQLVIYVPTVGEELPAEQVRASESNRDLDLTQDKINLNQATVAELQTLAGVGQKKAEDIVQYRETNGSFQTIEDLKNVGGFGEKTFERLKDQICVN